MSEDYRSARIGLDAWDWAHRKPRIKSQIENEDEITCQALKRVGSPAVARREIAEMTISNSDDITPCGGCKNATVEGCKNETGPFYDLEEKAVVCPAQKGVIYISNYNNGHQSE